MRAESTCKQIQRTWRSVLAASVLGLTALPALAATRVTSGHAGHWWSPERSGEGWVLEMIGADAALLYWFTYDEEGGQRWMTAEGRVEDLEGDGAAGQRIVFPQLVAPHGASFGEDFDPADVVREDVGSATLSFEGCDSGVFSFEAFGQSQSIEVARLAHVMGAACETPHGVTGREVAAHAGLSGSWFDPAHNGEGFALHWASPGHAIVTWYSYDDRGKPYWMLGVGGFDSEGRIRFADVHTTRGARFGYDFDPDDVERVHWGELTFELACDGGTAAYGSALPDFGNGGFDLTRITAIHDVPCPWTPPALSDLYTIEIVELPMQIEGMPADTRIGAIRSVGDGSLWALGQGTGPHLPLRLDEETARWRPVGTIDALGLFTARTTGRVVVNKRLDAEGIRAVVLVDGQWEPLDDELGENAHVTGMSADGSVIVGVADPGPEMRSWRWSEEAGVADLAPMPDAAVQPMPTFVTRHGDILGTQSTGPIRMQRAVRWSGDSVEPILSSDGTGLMDPATYAEGSDLLFVNAIREAEPSIAYIGGTWYLDRDNRLREIPTVDRTFRHYIVSTSLDGNLVAGVWGTFPQFSTMLPGFAITPAPEDVDGYLWTQHTGSVSIWGLVEDAGHDMTGWQEIYVRSQSADGLTVVIEVQGFRDAAGSLQQRPMLLRLTPTR